MTNPSKPNRNINTTSKTLLLHANLPIIHKTVTIGRSILLGTRISLLNLGATISPSNRRNKQPRKPPASTEANSEG